MFDSVSRSEVPPQTVSRVPASVRGDSEVAVSFGAVDGRTLVSRLFERGALRLRYPRANGAREAVIVNTGGGVTGGDRLRLTVHAGAGATAVVTSQAAEKIYRSDGPAAMIEAHLRLEAGARLDWLPQETILFDHAIAERRLEVDMTSCARLTVLECLVLGRVAHGEILGEAHWRDRWRIRRDGRLVLAESVRLSGNVSALMQRPATGGGARAVATLVHIAPDAEQKLDAVRAALSATSALAGASAWNGMLVARITATDPAAMRIAATDAAIAVTQKAMPRAWAC